MQNMPGKISDKENVSAIFGTSYRVLKMSEQKSHFCEYPYLQIIWSKSFSLFLEVVVMAVPGWKQLFCYEKNYVKFVNMLPYAVHV